MADERATRARSARRAVGAAVVAIVWLLAVAGAVLAASPHRLEGPITDDVGALTGSNAAMESSIEELQTSTGAQLWIWFTDTLGGADSSSFASETAQASDLGTTDLLLVVALDDRAYGWWKGDDVDLSDSELAGILSRDLEAGLRAETYGTAVRNTAAAIQNAILAPDPVDATPAPGSGQTVPPIILFWAAMYALLYCGMALVVSLLFFEDRDLT